MGDGVLAYFGYPRADEHDAERAVRAALKLVEKVAGLDTVAAAPLQLRVGIATGLAGLICRYAGHSEAALALCRTIAAVFGGQTGMIIFAGLELSEDQWRP
jgi:hypothetical protein